MPPLRISISAALVFLVSLPHCTDESTILDAASGDVARDAGVTTDGADAVDAAGRADPVDAGPISTPSVSDSVVVFDRARISSRGDAENFHRVRAEVDFGPGPFREVIAVLELHTTCFPFEAASAPPPGQFWPADCDAFDRSFELTLDPPDSEDAPPGLELIHAVTPFGGPMTIREDITDVANGLPGRHLVEIEIPTYSDAAGRVSGSDGGWNVSLRFERTTGPAPRRVLAVIPLLRGTVEVRTASVGFSEPPGTRAARIAYRATGHGGGEAGPNCIGPAEEFCRRRHVLSVDDEALIDFDAWRADCAELCTDTPGGLGGRTYCRENPTGDPRSVRAPRANWCPGSVTPPVWLDVARGPGPHRFSYAINALAPGGNWRLSAVYFAYGD